MSRRRCGEPSTTQRAKSDFRPDPTRSGSTRRSRRPAVIAADGPVVEGVEAGHVGAVLLGEALADFAFDEAEDGQGQADHGDQASGMPEVLRSAPIRSSSKTTVASARSRN